MGTEIKKNRNLYHNHCPNKTLMSSSQRSIGTSTGSRGIGGERKGLNPVGEDICPAERCHSHFAALHAHDALSRYASVRINVHL